MADTILILYGSQQVSMIDTKTSSLKVHRSTTVTAACNTGSDRHVLVASGTNQITMKDALTWDTSASSVVDLDDCNGRFDMLVFVTSNFVLFERCFQASITFNWLSHKYW